MNEQSQTGFTLIEVLVVIALAGILAALAVPSYQDVVRKAKRAEGRTALIQLMQQQERYYSMHTSYLAFSSESLTEEQKRFKWFSGDNARRSAYEIGASACPGDTIQHCVVVTATPGTAKVDAGFADSQCGVLSMSSNGAKSPGGSLCW